MSWTSTMVTQPGNSTLTWVIGPHDDVTNHDCIVLRGGGASGIRINSVTLYDVYGDEPRLAGLPTAVYQVSVSVIGSAPAAFKFSAEAMD